MNYSWEQDFAAGYNLVLRMLALRHGSVRPATLYEQYWLESQGLIP